MLIALWPIGIKVEFALHYRNIDFLLGVILAVGPFFTSNKCRILSFSPTKSKRFRIPFNSTVTSFWNTTPPSSWNSAIALLTSSWPFWYGVSRCACHSGLCSRFWNCHICRTKRRLWTMHYNTAQVRITCFTVAFLYVTDGQYAWTQKLQEKITLRQKRCDIIIWRTFLKIFYLFSTNTGLKVRVETIGVVLYGAFG